ncbi:uncharacterized protein [Dendropsophus ebraccatus]|uniref:uncharacterized protein n=1 Tax=Dendropsophus ebraccatus TaxID=150705 RepID=UPI00383144E9
MPDPISIYCAFWNSRSVCNKITETHDLFLNKSLILLALMKTWLQESDTASPAALTLGGLQFSHSPRPYNRHGGGVGILLSQDCTYQVIHPVPFLLFSSFEVHTIRLLQPFSLRVAVIYRPPGSRRHFLYHFSTWLPNFLSSDIPALIMGDFNIPIDKPLSPSAAQFLSLTSSLGLSQLSDSPTHKDGKTLDLFFSRLCPVSYLTSTPIKLSDHNLFSFSISNTHSPPDTPTSVKYRNLRAINTQQLLDSVQSSLPPISLLSCPNLAATYYHNTLKTTLNKMAPSHLNQPNADDHNPGTHLDLVFFYGVLGVQTSYIINLC